MEKLDYETSKRIVQIGDAIVSIERSPGETPFIDTMLLLDLKYHLKVVSDRLEQKTYVEHFGRWLESKDDPVIELWRSKFLKETYEAFDDLAKTLTLMGMEVDTGAKPETASAPASRADAAMDMFTDVMFGEGREDE